MQAAEMRSYALRYNVTILRHRCIETNALAARTARTCRVFVNEENVMFARGLLRRRVHILHLFFNDTRYCVGGELVKRMP